MSFFSLSDNTTLETTGSFEAAPMIDVIPNDTSCLAMIEEAGWAQYEGDEYINLRWTVVEPAIYKNRKIFQKVRVYDADAKKADKAKRMLAAIDANAGGKLVASGEEPTDMAMAKSLLNKPMIIKVMVWEMGDRKGNWVSAVAPRQSKAAKPAPAPVADIDEDIDF